MRGSAGSRGCEDRKEVWRTKLTIELKWLSVTVEENEGDGGGGGRKRGGQQ